MDPFEELSRLRGTWERDLKVIVFFKMVQKGGSAMRFIDDEDIVDFLKFRHDVRDEVVTVEWMNEQFEKVRRGIPSQGMTNLITRFTPITAIYIEVNAVFYPARDITEQQREEGYIGLKEVKRLVDDYYMMFGFERWSDERAANPPSDTIDPDTPEYKAQQFRDWFHYHFPKGQIDIVSRPNTPDQLELDVDVTLPGPDPATALAKIQQEQGDEDMGLYEESPYPRLIRKVFKVFMLSKRRLRGLH